MYNVVEIPDRLIGGHFAVQSPCGKTIGGEYNLDYTRANDLANSLNRAWQDGIDFQKKVLEKE